MNTTQLLNPKAYVSKWLVGAAMLACFGTVHAEVKHGHQADIEWITGGVGESEEAKMKSRADDYNLDLLFISERGHYLSDVGVTIDNAKGESILNTRSSGPYLLTNLPTGDYTVYTSFNGERRQRDVAIVQDSQTEIRFNWQFDDAKLTNTGKGIYNVVVIQNGVVLESEHAETHDSAMRIKSSIKADIE